MRRAAIVSPLRTPVGRFGGALKDVPVERLGALVVHEMQRRKARYGLETMCIGGGQGVAAIFERG